MPPAPARRLDCGCELRLGGRELGANAVQFIAQSLLGAFGDLGQRAELAVLGSQVLEALEHLGQDNAFPGDFRGITGFPGGRNRGINGVPGGAGNGGERGTERIQPHQPAALAIAFGIDRLTLDSSSKSLSR